MALLAALAASLLACLATGARGAQGALQGAPAPPRPWDGAAARVAAAEASHAAARAAARAAGAPRVPRSLVQVGIVTSLTARGGAYFARWERNSRGWQRDFEDVLTYVFDPVHPRSPLAAAFRNVTRLSGIPGVDEDLGYANFAQLPAWRWMHEHNPTAEWYLGTDDDTVVVTANLLRLIETLRPRLNASGGLAVVGKCIGSRAPLPLGDPDEGSGGRFSVGYPVHGAGVLMSNALVRRLAPHVDACRVKYNNARHSDTLLGACLQREVLRCDVEGGSTLGKPSCLALCPPPGFAFSFWSPEGTAERYLARGGGPRGADALPVTFHEKLPDRIDAISEFLREAARREAEEPDTPPLTMARLAPLLERLARAGANSSCTMQVTKNKGGGVGGVGGGQAMSSIAVCD